MSVVMYEFQARTQYVVYADGSAIGNGNEDAPGGWAFVILDKAEKNILHLGEGGVRGTTNNRMELTAAIEAIRCFPPDSYINLKLDSQYVLKGGSEWLPGWLRKGFKKNEDLWRDFIEVARGKNFLWTWVKGHSNNPWNEKVDGMAYAQSLLSKTRPYVR